MNEYSKNIKLNDVISVKVSGLTNFGVFCIVDVDNEKWNGLIHISEISNKFVNDITDFFRIEDILKVKIIGIDYNKKQLKLSYKSVDENIKQMNPYALRETNSGFKNLDKFVKNKLKESK